MRGGLPYTAEPQWYRNHRHGPRVSRTPSRPFSVVLIMNALGRLALLFVIVPIVELLLLIQLGQVVGMLPTILLVIATGVGGAALARAEGLRVFFEFQRELASGRLPGQALLDGISVLIGGAFLLTPGVLTDFVGFSLLLPFTRRWIQRRVRARLERQIEEGSIRVVTMQSGFGGFAGFGPGSGADGGFSGSMGPEDADGRQDDPTADGRRLDPSKGIVVEPKE